SFFAILRGCGAAVVVQIKAAIQIEFETFFRKVQPEYQLGEAVSAPINEFDSLIVQPHVDRRHPFKKWERLTAPEPEIDQREVDVRLDIRRLSGKAGFDDGGRKYAFPALELVQMFLPRFVPCLNAKLFFDR